MLLSFIFMSSRKRKKDNDLCNMINKLNTINIGPCINNLENEHSFRIAKCTKNSQKS